MYQLRGVDGLELNCIERRIPQGETRLREVCSRRHLSLHSNWYSCRVIECKFGIKSVETIDRDVVKSYGI